MQTHFTYDEVTPLEQCIVDFMAAQELCTEKKRGAKTKKKSRQNS
ncbi:MAG: hypothetical protein ACOYNL_02535 [Rickettsiales bacterium]